MNRITLCFTVFSVFLFHVQAQTNPDPYNIGDIGPGGGIIFYEKSDWTDGWKYLEAAPANWTSGVPSSNATLDPIIAFGTSVAEFNSTTKTLGNGDINTLNTSSYHNNYNNAFYNNSFGGKRGWFLPSWHELLALYSYKETYGNDYLNIADEAYYNSSTDPYNVNIAYLVNMANGNTGYTGKGGGFRKRAIRKVTLFDISPDPNKSLYFSSDKDFVNFGNSVHFQISPNNTRNYLFWLKPESTGYIFSKYKNLDATNSDLFIRYDASVEKIIFSSNGTNTASFGPVPLNEWSFVAITVRQTETGNEMKGYINGELIVTSPINISTTQTQQDFIIGYNSQLANGADTQGFTGYLDEFSIWSSVGENVSVTNDYRPFNSSEISSYMNYKPNGFESRMNFYLDFDSENLINQSRYLTDFQSVTFDPVASGIQYSTDTPYEYNLAPSDVGFLVGGQIVDEIDINDDTSANSVIGSLSATDLDNSLESLTISLDDNSGTQNHNEYFAIENNQLKILIQPNLGATDDSDVDTYFTATGLNEITYKQALNTFVSRLKSNGIWNKLIAIYPILGGGSESSSYNLKDPTAFQIQWPSDFTFNSGGVLTSGVSSANTGIGVYNTDLSNDNASVSIYVGSENAGEIAIGAVRGAKGIQIVPRNSSDEWGGKMYTSENSNLPTTTAKGFYQFSRNNLDSYLKQRNGDRYEVVETAVLPDEPKDLTIGGLETNAFSAQQYQFASAGESLTEQEMDLFYSYVEQLQIDLERQTGDKSSTPISDNISYSIDVLVSDGQSQLRKTLIVNVLPTNTAPTDLGFSETTSDWTFVEDTTQNFNSAWTYTLPATNTESRYKMVVSGTYGIANNVPHRDGYYGLAARNLITGCDANWSFDGQCPAPEPSSPEGYSEVNTYEYIIENGKQGGYELSWSDGNYGDNSGSLTFATYVEAITSSLSYVISIDENVGDNFTISNLSGIDSEDSVLTFSLDDDPSLVNDNDQFLISSPALVLLNNPDYESKNQYLVDVKVSDSQFSFTRRLTVNINDVNDAPTVADVTATTDEDSSILIDLQGVDVDGDGLVYVGMSEPANGTVIINNGQADYTPNENFNGIDSFTYVANDSTIDSAEATVTITVTAVNDAPTVADVTTTTDEDTAVEITLTGSDIDEDALTFSVGEAANGTVTLEDAVATYTPDANFTGTDSFTYTASDAEATSSAATVTITVTAVNDAPTVADVTKTTDEDTAVEITLTGTDLDWDDLTFSVGEAANGTVTLEGAVATYTPDVNFTGTDSFTYTASDAEATSSAATVTITVTAVNDAPTVADVTAEVVSQGEVSITLVGSDIDTESLTFEIVDQPEYGTIEIEGSTVNYTNTSYKQTEDRFTYKANDGSLDSEVGEVVITITPYPEIEVSSTVIESACGALEGSILITTKNLVGDVTYNWTGPDDFEATTQNISGLNPGNYSLTISDDIATKSFEFTVSEKPIYQDLEICYVTTDENSNHNKIVLKYPGIYNDKSYQILREGTEAGIYEFIGEINSGETFFLDTTSNNTSRIYSYKVRLKDNCDNLSEQSDYHRTILLQSSVATDNSVNLNWSKYEGRSYSSYLIYRSVNDDPFEEIATISSNSTSYNDTEADISVNAYTYYIAIKVNSCAVETITSSKKAKRSLPLIKLATEDAIEIQSNRKEIATLNNPPTVQPVSFSTDEDTAVVVTLSGSDEDENTLSFSASEPDHGTVTISGNSLTYTPDADYFGVDSFTYTANDGGLTSEAALVEVTISPINDKPALAAISELSFSEDSPIGTVITTLEATDIDSETISYSISADTNNYFELDGAVIQLKSSLDFESDAVITVNVIATDGELSDTKELVVNVEDVPNNSVEQEYSITVYDVENEDNTEKLDYTQWTNSTESSGSGDFIFEISGGEDAALFTIDPITGALDFIEAPDYENPSDANGDNVYIVIVKITNINDGAPEIPVVSSQTSVAVPEAQTAAADVDAINTTNDTDTDQDGVIDTEDNCPITYNPDQEDMDGDGIGDVCDDSDMDTFFDVFDQCPNSAYGVTVDAKGCEVFALPANTFSVTVTSATCPDSSNGSITISSSNTDYSYRFAIDDQAPQALTDNTQTISNLSAGIYTICVTVDGVSDYQRCYTIEITEPAPLVASSRVDVSARNLQLDLSGASEYQVTLNGKTLLTNEDRLSLNLQPGMNRVEVATALDCQGIYFEEIFVSEEVKVYPNPTPGPLQLFVAGSDSEVTLSITNLSGNVIRKETLAVPANRIIETTLGNLPEGLYLITLNGRTVKTTHKVIKE